MFISRRLLKSQFSSGQFRFLRATPHVARSRPAQKERLADLPSLLSPTIFPPSSSFPPLLNIVTTGFLGIHQAFRKICASTDNTPLSRYSTRRSFKIHNRAKLPYLQFPTPWAGRSPYLPLLARGAPARRACRQPDKRRVVCTHYICFKVCEEVMGARQPNQISTPWHLCTRRP
ncbi:hypothetical protein B0H13DRAFT_2665565 [Mycena leptocephala]|nr:hypothetical protein B0H13DRAFT_2665565 [Mycena leptocephala]